LVLLFCEEIIWKRHLPLRRHARQKNAKVQLNLEVSQAHKMSQIECRSESQAHKIFPHKCHSNHDPRNNQSIGPSKGDSQSKVA
jgi:hypothetical protein